VVDIVGVLEAEFTSVAQEAQEVPAFFPLVTKMISVISAFTSIGIG
jgi:hypothetical protein